MPLLILSCMTAEQKYLNKKPMKIFGIRYTTTGILSSLQGFYRQ